MNDKLKSLGFQKVKSGKASNYITVDDLGLISFSGRLRRELNIKRTENCCIYFNPDEGVLAIHIGTFDRKKHQDLSITKIEPDNTIRARDELTAIHDDYRGFTFIPEEGLKNTFDQIEVEDFKEQPDPYSRMLLVTIKKEKTSFR